jgi:hypothetical protein
LNGVQFIKNFEIWRMSVYDVVWYGAVRYTRRCTVQCCIDIVDIMVSKAAWLVLSQIIERILCVQWCV